MPPLHGDSADHKIKLILDKNNKAPDIFYSLLYQMSRKELLILWKTLTEYLDKDFIWVSNSSAAAPVLFTWKPGSRLQFCINYQALNTLTKKNWYPLSLINETLECIEHTAWFMKLDVIHAFHKIWIAEGSKWITAFRMRYKLFE